jgi:hypothetical protein
MTMHLPISYGKEFAKCFYLDTAPSLLMRPLTRAQLAVTRLTVSRCARRSAVIANFEWWFLGSVAGRFESGPAIPCSGKRLFGTTFHPMTA